MLRRLEQAAKSQKVRILALFVVLAVVAVVAVLAGDDYGEYFGSSVVSDYTDYQGLQVPELSFDPWHVTDDYQDYSGGESGNQFLVPENEGGGQQQGYIQEPGSGIPGQEEDNVGQDIPGINENQDWGDQNPAETMTPSPTDAPLPTEAPGQNEGIFEIDPSGGGLPVPLSDYSIYFDLDGGVLTGASNVFMLVPSGTIVATAVSNAGSVIPGAAPSALTFTNHVFDGWQYVASPSGISTIITDFADFASIVVDHHIVFTAQWTEYISVNFQMGLGSYYIAGVNQGSSVVRQIPPSTALTEYNVPQSGATASGQPRLFMRDGGYRFVGWQETVPGFNVDLPSEPVTTALLQNIVQGATDRYFRAVWQRYFTVTFTLEQEDIDNGAFFIESGDAADRPRYVDEGANIYSLTTRPSVGSPIPSMPGAVFTRWYTNPPFATGGAINGDLILIAGFSTSEDVTFHFNSGWHTGFLDVGPLTISLPAVPAQHVGFANAPNLTRTGWTFGGWQVGSVYTPGSPIIDLDMDAEALLSIGFPLEFVAVWVRTTILVTFDFNNGWYPTPLDLGPIFATVYTGANISYMDGGPFAFTIPNVPVHPNGYPFIGWEANDGTVFSVPFTFLYNLTISAPMTFTALWDEGMVDVVFQLDGGTYSIFGTGPVIRPRNPGSLILIANVPYPTRENHTFIGWLYHTGDGVTRDRVSTAALPVATGGALFIAQWEHIRHNVTFVLSDGFYWGSPADVIRSVRQGETITSPGTTPINSAPIAPGLDRPSHSFVGWQRVGDPFGSPPWSSASAAALSISGPETFIAIWSGNLTQVVFNLDGGNVAGDTSPIIRTDMPVGLAITTINVPNPTRENYILNGWYDEINSVILTTQQVGDEFATAMPNYRVFTARWSPVLHEVIFVFNGGNIGGNIGPIVMHVPHDSIVNKNIGGLNVPMPPALVRSGHSFTGWYLSNIFYTASPGSFVVTGPAMFMAQWVAGELAEVIFDFNGGNFGGDPNPLTFSRLVGLPFGPLVPDPVIFTNREFLYWARLSDGVTMSSIQVAAWEVTSGSTTWVAQWYQPEHDVTFFFFDTGELTDFESITVDHGAQILAIPTTSRVHYTLIGWRRDGVGEILEDIDIIGMSVYSSLTFIAVWARNTHDIFFDLNGGEYDGSSANILVVAREGEPLDRVPTPTREHYNLTGWRWFDSIADAWVYFTPTEIAMMDVEDSMTFVAVWQRISHLITFVLNGGNIAGDTTNVTTTINQGTVIGAANVPGLVSHPTSNFTHWLREDNNNFYTPDDVALLLVTATPGSLRFIAQWDARVYTVTFQLNGGNIAGSTSDVTPVLAYQSVIGGSVPEPVKDTFTLMGWRVVSGAAITGNVYSSVQVAGRTVTGEITFEAEWVHMPQRVTFDLNGGEVAGSTANITVFRSEGSTLGAANIPNPTMGASVLTGWRINGVGQIFTLPTMADFIVLAPTTFVALWDHDVYEITFVLNGGEFNGSPADVVIEIAEGYEIATGVPTPEREHWTLLGWREDGVGTTLTPAQVADVVVNDDMTFVAVWQRNQHSVTFILAGGMVAGDMDNIGITVLAGDAIGINNVPIPTRIGSMLTGWQLEGAGTVLNRAEVGDVVVTGALVYIAVWDMNFFPVSFDLAGGIFAGSTAAVQHNLLAGSNVGSGLIPNPVRENYSLDGWQLGSQGATLSTAFIAGIEVDRPLSFAAIWSPILHNIVFDLNGGNIGGNTANVVNPVAQGIAIGSANVAATPVLAGSTFVGWREEGTAVVRTPAQVAELTVEGTRRFTAVWDEDIIPITFVLNGGNVGGATVNIEASVIYGRAVGAIVVPLPVRSDHELIGWLLATNVLTPMQVAATHVHEALTFTAQWAPITHPVTFLLDGGTYLGSTANVVRQINQNATVTAANVPTPIRGVSVFSGWRELGEQVTLTPAQVAALTITGPRFFVAVWDATEFEVIFDLAGGNVAGATANITRAVIGGDRIGGHNVPEPNRGYFVHSGWRLNNAGPVLSGVQVAGVEVTGNLSYTADWTPVSRDVILGRDPYTASIPGHATAVYTYTVNTGANIDVTFIIIPPGNGAIFTSQSIAVPPIGYFIVAGPTILANGSMQVTIRRMTGEDLDLPEFTVTFNAMAGSLPTGEPGFRRGPHGTRIDTFPIPNPPAGQEFVGWFYTGARVIPSMIITRDITLTAGFQLIGTGQLFTVVHNPNGGILPQGVSGTNQHVYGTSLTSHPIPTRTGHAFAGWHLNGVQIPNPLIVRSNMTLIAHWVSDHVVTPPPTASPPPSTSPPPWCNIPSNFYIVAFNPHPGVHAVSGETGIRVGVRNSVIHNIPATPVRAGHVFGGWRLPTGAVLVGPLTITGNMTLTAIWTPVGACPSTKPPAPSSQPPGGRPNPQTDPIQVSFMIFGAVLLVGAAAYTILKLAKKHAEAADQYLIDTTRHEREKRITDMFRRKPKK